LSMSVAGGKIITNQTKGVHKMARIATGVSKKSNRQNLEALALAQAWGRQFGVGTKCDAEFAWYISYGKFGQKSGSTEMLDTFKIALWLIKNPR